MFCSSCGAPISPDTRFCGSCGTPVAVAPPAAPAEPAPPPAYQPMQSYPPPTPVPTGVAGCYFASWGDRAIGYIIDSLIVGGVMVVLYVIAGVLFGGLAAVGGNVGSSGMENLAGGMCCLLGVLFPVATLAVGIYNRVYLVAQRGYSIGQGVMKLKVIDVYGNKLSQGTALLRLLAQLAISLVPFAGIIDLLWPLWDLQKQTLHDKVVSSFVVYNR